MTERKSKRNQTLSLSAEEMTALRTKLFTPDQKMTAEEAEGNVFNGDSFEVAKLLPEGAFDLLILDPPYNLDKDFHGFKFSRISDDAYFEYIDRCLSAFVPLLAPTASVYLCGDWQCTAALYAAAQKHLKIRNRITWQREKGRGALHK